MRHNAINEVILGITLLKHHLCVLILLEFTLSMHALELVSPWTYHFDDFVWVFSFCTKTPIFKTFCIERDLSKHKVSYRKKCKLGQSDYNNELYVVDRPFLIFEIILIFSPKRQDWHMNMLILILVVILYSTS